MKRILILITLIAMALCAYAKDPKLNVEKLFDGRFRGAKDVSLRIIKDKVNYFRSLDMPSKLPSAKEVRDAFAKDVERSNSSSYSESNGEYRHIIVVKYNGKDVSVCLCEEDGDLSIFISGPMSAFE